MAVERLVASTVLASHAASVNEDRVLALLADAVHLLAAAPWRNPMRSRLGRSMAEHLNFADAG